MHNGETVVLRCGAIIDGVSREPRGRTELWISGGVIRDMRQEFTPDRDLPGETRKVEAEDMTILPGLIDAHVHLCSSAEPDPTTRSRSEGAHQTAVRGTVNARATLLGGVTTIRVMGTPEHIDLDIRDLVNAGVAPGPRIHAAGRGLCITGGHGWYHSIECDGPGEFKSAARDLIKRGVNAIKIKVTGGVMTPGIRPGVPQMDREEIAAVLHEAGKRGIPVGGHTEGRQGIKDAVSCGIDSIEHGYFIDDEESLQIMKDRAIYLVPTIIAYDLIAEGGDRGVPAEAVENSQMAVDTNRESFRMAVEAGVPIAMGSDAGTAFNYHGMSGRELVYMVDCGMTPMAAISAATTGGAALLGIADEVGSVAVGKRADLIAVRGNPAENVADVVDAATVLQDGTVVKERGRALV